MNPLDEAVDQLVTGADPSLAAAQHDTLDDVWLRIESEIDQEQASGRPARRRRIVLATVGALGAVVALSAAAPIIATRTGLYLPQNEVAMGGPGEVYDLGGSDLPAQLATLSSDIPYPDQASRSTVIAAMAGEFTAKNPTGERVTSTTGALRADLAKGAVCSWAHRWQAAKASNDVTGRQAAATALQGALTWSAVTDVDPQPAIDGESTDAGKGPTIFGYLPGIIKATSTSNTGELDRLLIESGYCVDVDPMPADAGTATGDPQSTDLPNTTETTRPPTAEGNR